MSTKVALKKRSKNSALSLQAALLSWYDSHRRVMPWRAAAGKRPNPYHVWLSEIMLQQTTVVTVGPYFQRFVERWPRVQDLAAASPDEVMATWAGLGYYARARNLHACAKAVAAAGGRFPETIEALLDLPGIGPYTAAAIASIAFDRPAVAVDGNVERVVSRFFAITEPLPTSKPALREGAAVLAAGVDRPGDFTQAFMELGATVCTPRNPRCGQCPWQKNCQARALGIQAELPRKLAKKARPVRYGHVYVLRDALGRVLIEKRQGTGLYQDMYQLPTTTWETDRAVLPVHGSDRPARQAAGIAVTGLTGAEFTALTEVRHILTHFELRLQVWAATVSRTVAKALSAMPARVWVKDEALKDYGIPQVMKKALAMAQPAVKGRRRG